MNIIELSIPLLIEKLKTGFEPLALSVSISDGRLTLDLFNDHDDTPKTGHIYRFRETPKGYDLELIERADWKENRHAFDTLQTLSRLHIDNKKGLKALRAVLDVLREKYKWEPRQFFGSFSCHTIYYTPYYAFKD